jgi:hypothetical protein
MAAVSRAKHRSERGNLVLVEKADGPRPVFFRRHDIPSNRDAACAELSVGDPRVALSDRNLGG